MPAPHSPLLPALALSFNAFAWGISWWPFRQLEARGLHPLWATVIVCVLSWAVIVALRPRALRELARTPVLWLIALASGITNAAFNWGIVAGDVVRVVLLFYLMPLWAVLLARLLLGERLDASAGVRVALALAGAAIVLWPAGGGLPLPASLADALGLVSGFSFALNNVMLRREARRSAEGRALAMFTGGVLVAATLAGVLVAAGHIAAPPQASFGWVAATLLLGGLFLLSNLALQYGASRLPAQVTAVIMLTEVLFASVSALALGAGTLSAPLVIGGGLILLAALVSVRRAVPSPDISRGRPP